METRRRVSQQIENIDKEIEIITLPEPEFKKSGNKNANWVKKEH